MVCKKLKITISSLSKALRQLSIIVNDLLLVFMVQPVIQMIL